MSPRTVARTLVLVAAATLAATLLWPNGARYRVQLELSSANGLREGSDVKVGGIAVGTVRDLKLRRGDQVVADLELDRGRGPIGRGASAQIVTSNLLGSKFVQLDPGDLDAPRRSGAAIRRDGVTYPVDLDEVLNVLDPDSRTRLQVLINETGTALLGRRADFNAMLRLLPPSLADGARLLEEVNADSRNLERLVVSGAGFIRRVNEEQASLNRVVDVAGRVMEATAGRRVALRQTLREAPATLRSLQRFLDELRATTRPLEPAARAIAATAPALAAVLGSLPEFQHEAEPVLTQAVGVSPSLTRLADDATPVLHRAKPTLRALSRFADTAAPLSRTLRVSIDDALGVLEGWARAIQVRDRLGHVFRGRVVMGVETLRSLVDRVAPVPERQKSKRGSGGAGQTSAGTPVAPVGSSNTSPSRRPDPVAPLIAPVERLLDKLLPSRDQQRPPAPAPAADGAVTDLLDFLLRP